MDSTRQSPLPVSKSDMELEAIFQHASVGIAFTLNRVFIRCNRAIESAFGYEAGGLNGKTTATLFSSEAEYQQFAGAFKPQLTQGETVSRNWTFHTRSGTPVICKISATPLSLALGDEGTVWLFYDITKEHLQARQLSASHTALQAVMNNAPVAILFTRDRLITQCNAKFVEMFGFTGRSPMGERGRVLYPTDEDYAELGRLATPLLSLGLPFTHELQMMRQGGERFWAHMVAYVLDPKDSTQGTVWIISDRSAEKLESEKLHHALFEKNTILDNVTIGIVFLKARQVQLCNPYAERMFGFAAGTMVGTSTRYWYRCEADYEAVASDLYPGLNTARASTLELMLQRQDGELFWARISGRLIEGTRPLDDASIWAIEDITDQHQVQEELRSAIALSQSVFNSANVSIIATDAVGTITLINATARNWLGYTSEELVGKHTPAIIHDPQEVVTRAEALSQELGWHVEPGFDVFVARARLYGTDEHEWSYIRKDLSIFPVLLSISTLKSQSGEITGFLGIGLNIMDRRRADAAIQQANEALEQRVSERTAQIEQANLQLQKEIQLRSAAEQKMRQMAHFDALTGLPNRLLLSDRLEQGLIQAERRTSILAVAYLDLDGFKAVNDTHGHAVGDSLLVQVAERLTQTMREVDTFARLGGDEFVAVLTDLESVESSVPVLKRMLHTAAQPVQVDSLLLQVSASIGVSYYPQKSGADADQLLRQADQAMYTAKLLGKNRYAVFDAEKDFSVRGYNANLERIRQALESGEFVLYYQPKVNMRTREFTGVEALIRWIHPQDGLLPPARFLPLIESHLLSINVGEWVIRQALRQLARWHRHGSLVPISVNIGALQLQQPDFFERLQAILAEFPTYQAYTLQLEILETSALEDIDQVSRFINRCEALGISFALDDFGTGYSSLTYLNRLPISTIKIDQSFVRDMLLDSNVRSILDGVLWIMRQLNRSVIAEGVETLKHGSMLMGLGCEFAQGYGIARPMPVEELPTWLERWKQDSDWQEVAKVPTTAL